MTELANIERLGDYQGAYDAIDRYLEDYSANPYKDVLRLRQLAYREKMVGFEKTKQAYETFLKTTTNALAQQQAKTLLWFHEHPSHALLGVYCNNNTRIYLDGKKAAEVEDPQRLRVYALKLSQGEHALALEARWKQYPSWVLASLRTHTGDFATSPSWKCAYNPPGAFSAVHFDESTWREVGGTGVKGPPEVPFVWTEPNAYIDMQSKAIGLRPPEAWGDKTDGATVYRHHFEL